MNNCRLPSLKAIRTFEVAARQLSFTKAAQELYVTPGAVSRLISSLEDELGIALFHRNGNLLTLTNAGSEYYKNIKQALDHIVSATQMLKMKTENAVLKVNTVPTFSIRWLVPRLHRFRALYPDIFVDVSSGEQTIDFHKEPIDLGIRYGFGDWPDTKSTFLMHEEIGVFCAPALLQNGVPLTEPKDLISYRLLQHTTRSYAWLEYFDAFGLTSVQPPIFYSFEHFFMLIEAAISGMGIVILPLLWVEPELRSGQLIQPLKATVRSKRSYYILHAKDTKNSKIQLFKEWLLNEGQ